MKIQIKALQCVMMRTGLVERDVVASFEDADHEAVMHQVDAGHFELVSVDESESTGAADDPSGSQQDEGTGESTETPAAGDAPTKRKGGRPKGSKNKASVPPEANPEVTPDGNVSNTDNGSDATSGV